MRDKHDITYVNPQEALGCRQADPKSEAGQYSNNGKGNTYLSQLAKAQSHECKAVRKK